jgi:hypothetical protein
MMVLYSSQQQHIFFFVSNTTVSPEIETLDNVPGPLLRNILRKVCFGDLLLYESSTVDQTPFLPVLWQTHFASAIQEPEGQQVFESIQSSFSCPDGNHIQLFRAVCIQSFLQKSVERGIDVSWINKYETIFTHDKLGSRITGLFITLHTQHIALDAWFSILELLPNLRRMSVTIIGLADGYVELLLQLLSRCPALTMELDIILEDDMASDELSDVLETIQESSLRTSPLPVKKIDRVDETTTEENRSKAIDEEHVPATYSLKVRKGSPGISVWQLLSIIRQINCFSGYLCNKLDLSSQLLELRGALYIGSAWASKTSSVVHILTHLNLGNCGLGGAGVMTVIDALSNSTVLTALDLSANVQEADVKSTEAGLSIAKWLSSTVCRVATLNLSLNAFTSAAIVAISESVKLSTHLSSLEMASTDLNVGVKDLFASVQQSRRRWRRLDISHNTIRARTLTLALEQWTHVDGDLLPEELKLDGMPLIDGILEILIAVLRTPHCSIRKLSLQGSTQYKLETSSAAETQSFWRDLLKCNLEQLDLSNQSLQDADFDTILEALPSSKLNKAIFATNSASDKTASRFEKLLNRGSMSKAITVDFRQNYLTQAKCKSFAKYNNSMTTIYTTPQRQKYA